MIEQERYSRGSIMSQFYCPEKKYLVVNINCGKAVVQINRVVRKKEIHSPIYCGQLNYSVFYRNNSDGFYKAEIVNSRNSKTLLRVSSPLDSFYCVKLISEKRLLIFTNQLESYMDIYAFDLVRRAKTSTRLNTSIAANEDGSP